MKGKPFFDRMYGRALAWRWMLSRSKGHFGFELGLAASGLLDIARFFVSPRNHPMPIVYVSGVVHIRTSLGDFRFFTRRATDDVYSCLPSREMDVEETIKNLLRKGDTFVDVGANVGYYSVLAGRAVGPSGRVIAVEPIPETAAVLRRNLHLNDVTGVVRQEACWSVHTTVSLTAPPGAYGLASSVRMFNTPALSAPAAPLDDICQDLSTIRLIKIDVEGAEREVLLGAREVLTKTENLVVEVSARTDEIRAFLEQASFRVRALKFKPYLWASRG